MRAGGASNRGENEGGFSNKGREGRKWEKGQCSACLWDWTGRVSGESRDRKRGWGVGRSVREEEQ